MEKKKTAKKAVPKKTVPKKKVTPQKNITKKTVVKDNAVRIAVFSRAFTTMMHKSTAVGLVQEFIVECNIDGDLRDEQGRVIKFTSLDAANDFGAAHRTATGHKCIVRTSQGG